MNISRRDLLKVTSASGLVAAGLAASEGFLKPLLAQDEPIQVLANSEVAQVQTQSGEMSYRTLGRTGERVSAIGLGGLISDAFERSKKVLSSYAVRSTAASISWTTPGIITTAAATAGWVQRSRMGTGKRSS